MVIAFTNNELTTLSIEKVHRAIYSQVQITYTQNTLNEYKDILNENTKQLSFDYGKSVLIDQKQSTTTTPHQQGEETHLLSISVSRQGSLLNLTISMADVNPDNYAEDDYVQSIYMVNDVIKIFTYKLLSGTNSGIDSLLDLENKLGTYFPRLYVKIKQDRYHRQL